jgi:hypothetical protein
MEKIIIDFKRKENEAGWQSIIDNFGLRAAPLWFTWIKWYLILAGLQVLMVKSQSKLIGIIAGLSVFLLWFYFNGFFFRIEFRNFPLIERKKLNMAMSMIVSGICAIFFYLLAVYSATIFMK